MRSAKKNNVYGTIAQAAYFATNPVQEDTVIANSIGNGGIAGARMGEDPPVKKKKTKDGDYLANPEEISDDVYDAVEEGFITNWFDKKLNIAPAPVIIFGEEWCFYCNSAKNLCKQSGIRFFYMNQDLVDSADQNPTSNIINNTEFHNQLKKVIKEIKSLKFNSIPQIWINGKHIGGYSELHKFISSGKAEALKESYLQENPLWSSPKAEKKGKTIGKISALGAATVGTYYGHKADMVRKAYDADPGFTAKVLVDLHGWTMKTFGLDAPEANSVMNWVGGAGAGVLAAVGAYYTGKMVYWIRDMIKRGWSAKKANAAARVLQKKLQSDPKFASKMKMKMKSRAHGVAESLILEAQAKNPKYKMDKSEVLKGTAWDTVLVSGGQEALSAVKGNELGNWRFALVSAGVALMMHSTKDFLVRHRRVHEKAVRALEQAAKKLRKDMEFKKHVEEIVAKKTEAHRKKLHEATAPGAEAWVKNNKDRFKKRYGKDWEKYLYAHAWNLRTSNNGRLPRDFGKKKTIKEMMGLGKSRTRIKSVGKPRKIKASKSQQQNKFANKIRMVDSIAKTLM